MMTSDDASVVMLLLLLAPWGQKSLEETRIKFCSKWFLCTLSAKFYSSYIEMHGMKVS